MEMQELEIIKKNCEHDAELKALWDLHIGYEKLLDKYASKPFLTPVEEAEVKELKRKKLAGKTKLQTILDKYRP
jgi:uncharacterized protein YdcH (DUF465 family)